MHPLRFHSKGKKKVLGSFSISSHGRPGLGLHLAIALGLPLVMELLALPHSNLDLDLAVLQIHLRGNEGQPFLLGRAEQLIDLLAMQQQFPLTNGEVVVDIPVGVFADVSVTEPRFVVVDIGVGFAELNSPQLRSFHFGACQRNSGFILFDQKVFVTGTAILGKDLDGGFGRQNSIITLEIVLHAFAIGPVWF